MSRRSWPADAGGESWSTRVAGSIKSVGFGLLLVCATLPAMWCNEGRAVTTARSLEEGAALVRSVRSDTVDPANEGRLVHVVGRADTDELLQDPQLGVSANAIRLLRTTEMYQWQERETSQTRAKPGGGQETVKEYSYFKAWSEKEIDADLFHRSTSYENPGPVPFASTSVSARTVALGAFTLTPALVEAMKQSEPLPVAAERGVGPPPSTALRLHEGGFYRGRDPGAPEIGDLRVRFSVVRPQEVSVIAAQAGTSFLPYQTRAGDALQMLVPGRRDAAGMFHTAALADAVLTWILRAAGFVLVFGGLLLVFRPIAVLGEVVPLVGPLLGAGLWLLSLGLAGTLTMATVAAAWVFYRPLFAAFLLAAVAGTLYWLRRRSVRRRRSVP